MNGRESRVVLFCCGNQMVFSFVMCSIMMFKCDESPQSVESSVLLNCRELHASQICVILKIISFINVFAFH